jgi:hypothetical protein
VLQRDLTAITSITTAGSTWKNILLMLGLQQCTVDKFVRQLLKSSSI